VAPRRRTYCKRTSIFNKSGALLASELNLGTTLRGIRTSRRLSLAEVAEATNISPSFLSLVELGKSDITIGRLTRLAEFYKISFAELLGGDEVSDAEVVRTHEQRLIHSPAEGIDIYLLTADTRRTMMPMLLVFEPSAELAEYGRHEGEEMVHVLEGSLMLEIEGADPRLLEIGDTAYYSAERPHLFRNASGKKGLRVICVDSPPPTV
jgi:transcriptional regulator with XRE-family HTH domain